MRARVLRADAKFREAMGALGDGGAHGLSAAGVEAQKRSSNISAIADRMAALGTRNTL